jgi:hypothetical protein
MTTCKGPKGWTTMGPICDHCMVGDGAHCRAAIEISRYMLAFDYPGEDNECQACADLEGVRRELLGDVADDHDEIEGIMADLMRGGVWRDEGGSIYLYELRGTAGVASGPQASAQTSNGEPK